MPDTGGVGLGAEHFEPHARFGEWLKLDPGLACVQHGLVGAFVAACNHAQIEAFPLLIALGQKHDPCDHVAIDVELDGASEEGVLIRSKVERSPEGNLLLVGYPDTTP